MSLAISRSVRRHHDAEPNTLFMRIGAIKLQIKSHLVGFKRGSFLKTSASNTSFRTFGFDITSAASSREGNQSKRVIAFFICASRSLAASTASLFSDMSPKLTTILHSTHSRLNNVPDMWLLIHDLLQFLRQSTRNFKGFHQRKHFRILPSVLRGDISRLRRQ
jgi:hypothetical protein